MLPKTATKTTFSSHGRAGAEPSRCMGRKKRPATQRCAASLNEVVRLLHTYNPAVYTVETFSEEQLKGRNPEDATFIAEAFYGVLRYKPLLKGAVQAVVNRHSMEMTRKDEWLYMVVTYLLIFAYDELGYQRFAALVRSCATSTTFLLLQLLLDADSLAQYARPIWVRHYDASYIDANLIPRILQHAAILSPFLDSLRTWTGVPCVRELVKVAPANRGRSNGGGEGGRRSTAREGSADEYWKMRGAHEGGALQGEAGKQICLTKLLDALGYRIGSTQSEPDDGKKRSIGRVPTAATLGSSRPSTADHAGEDKKTFSRNTTDASHADFTAEVGIDSAVAETCGVPCRPQLNARTERSSCFLNNGRMQPTARTAYDVDIERNPIQTKKAFGTHCHSLQEHGSVHLSVTTCEKSVHLQSKAGGRGDAQQKSRNEVGSWSLPTQGSQGVACEKKQLPANNSRVMCEKLTGGVQKAEDEDEEEVEDEEYLTKDVDAQRRYLRKRREKESRRIQRKCQAFRQWALQRPTNMQKLLNEAEEKFRQECPFQPQRRSIPILSTKSCQETVRFTTSEVLRAESLLRQREEQIYARLRQLHLNKRDELPFLKWQAEQKKEQERQRLQNVALKRTATQLARAQAMHAAAASQRRRAAMALAMRSLAGALQRRHSQSLQEEKRRLAERALGIRAARLRPLEVVEVAKEERRQQAVEEKTKRALARAEASKMSAEEMLTKAISAREARIVERTAVRVRHLKAALRRRQCGSLFSLSAPTLNGMCSAEAKARLKFIRAERAERVKRKRGLIIRDKVEKREELFTKTTKLAVKRLEAAAEAHLRRQEERRHHRQSQQERLLRMEKAFLEQRDKIWKKKQQQRDARLRLATALRIQQINEEYLQTTKKNLEKRVWQQLIKGAERRATAMAEATKKEQALADGIRKKEKYLCAKNKAAAEDKKAAVHAARAEELRDLQRERDREQERAHRIVSEAAAVRRAEEKALMEKRRAQLWYDQASRRVV